MTDDVIHSTQYYINYINKASQFLTQANETWQANSSTANTPTAIENYKKKLLFSRPHPLDFNILAMFNPKNVKRGQKLELTYLYTECINGGLMIILLYEC